MAYAILNAFLGYPGETGPAAGMSATHAQEAARAWFAGELQGWRERGRMSRSLAGGSRTVRSGQPADGPIPTEGVCLRGGAQPAGRRLADDGCRLCGLEDFGEFFGVEPTQDRKAVLISQLVQFPMNLNCHFSRSDP